MATVLGTDASSLPPSATPLREIEGWDSLKHVMLVVGLERDFKVKLSAEEIRGIASMDDIARVLGQKGVDA